MSNERIKLEMTLKDIITVMADGNPGAMTVLMEIFNCHCDPDSVFKTIGPFLDLDRNHIYEERIWMLYKDVCKQDIRKTIAVLRATQLGIISSIDLNHAINNGGEGLNVDEVCKKLKKRLPRFQLDT